MDVWSTYRDRVGAAADETKDPRRENAVHHATDRLKRKLPSSVTYRDVSIDGKDAQVAIIDTPEFDTKKVFVLSESDLPHGGLIYWSDSYWLITEINANNDLYTEGRMRQCNYYLRWIDQDGNIISRWCVVEDGTKYLIGEKNTEMMTIGDARIAITIGKDSDTDKLCRGMRFLVDDLSSANPLAYEITKSNKLYNVYNGKGVFRFILSECNSTDNDNYELRIADYYSWKPKASRPKPDEVVDKTFEKIADAARDREERVPECVENKGVWI